MRARRVIVWVIEMLAEALLFAVLLLALEWRDIVSNRTPISEIVSEPFLTMIPILWFLFLTGYMLTTGVFRLAWKGRALWSYPTVATILFLLHFEILNFGLGGAFDPRVRIGFIAGGALVAFATTYVGGYFLRKMSVSKHHDA